MKKLKQEGMAGLQLQLGFQLTAACLSDSVGDDFVPLDGFPVHRRQLYNSKNRKVAVPHELLAWYPELKQKVGIFIVTIRYCLMEKFCSWF